MTHIQKGAQGSIFASAEAQETSPADIIADADTLILFDNSGSMDDLLYGSTRWNIAVRELMQLQRTLPGKIILLEFNSRAQFIFSGIPNTPRGTTDLAGALAHVHQFDNTGMHFIIISDGIPDSESRALEIANTFVDKISTVFIGPDNPLDRGALFLQSIATGKSMGRIDPTLLSSTIINLLTATNTEEEENA